ncbi:ankyrin repeat domain-containing protein 27-like isoform X4 [Branchiostoma floridae]|uniref:Ankyrin repeat domain-containing protein 27-like isoform X4 n=1 Tax=Branchiostoma floridae TaxID=7739 RepID=A0A9J7MUM2_BRAFL|nr:ankyrin repeat domain-containing protein 27-like isoform X4 [Branchiostoma floridae]
MFYNSSDHSYRVLCLDQFLEGRTESVQEPILVSLQSLEDCTEYLWGRHGNHRTRRQVDHRVQHFIGSYHQLEGVSLRHTMDAANTLFVRAMQTALKDNNMGKIAKQSTIHMDNLKIAMETYVMHGVFNKVFNTISTFTATEDAALNKVTRNLADVQLRDLGVRKEFWQSIPRARRELHGLNKFSSPLEKLLCVKRAITAITRPSPLHKRKESVTMSSDDLLPILVYLVIKADIPNWLANLRYLHNFRFSRPANDAFGFYLASLEAAIEHVKTGNVGVEEGSDQSLTSSSQWQAMQRQTSQDMSTILVLFEHIREGRVEGVEEMLGVSTPDHTQLRTKMCHPLCSCDSCERLVSGRRNDPTAVTAYSRDDKGLTALHVAAIYGRAEMIDLLVTKGGVVNATDYHGSTPLHLACQKGHQSAALLLLHFSADVRAQDNDGNTPLHLCCENGHEDCVKAVVYYDRSYVVLDINAANDNGDTPLHLASRWGYCNIVDTLLQNGASVEALNRKKQTSLDCAHNDTVSRVLLQALEDRQLQETEESFVKVRVMDASPPKPTRPNRRESGPLSINKLPTVPQDSPQQQREKQVEKLLKAVADGDIEMVRYLLCVESSDEDDEDVFDANASLCHPLCQCEKCHPVQKRTAVMSVDELSVNSANEGGFTSLHVAALHGRKDLTLLLLRNGANVNGQNKAQRNTPLHLACQHDHVKIVSALLDHGAKCNVKDHNGCTPLYLSATAGNLQPAQLLIQKGANVNQTNQRGNTALHEAARWNYPKLVSLLLQNGASAAIRNKTQLTPLQYAHNEAVAQLLRSHMEEKPADHVDLRPRARTASGSAGSEISDTNIATMQGESGPVGIKALFQAFDADDVKLSKQLGKEIKMFDKSKRLKKTITRDRSYPQLQLLAVEQISSTPALVDSTLPTSPEEQEPIRGLDTEEVSSEFTEKEMVEVSERDRRTDRQENESTWQIQERITEVASPTRVREFLTPIASIRLVEAEQSTSEYDTEDSRVSDMEGKEGFSLSGEGDASRNSDESSFRFRQEVRNSEDTSLKTPLLPASSCSKAPTDEKTLASGATVVLAENLMVEGTSSDLEPAREVIPDQGPQMTFAVKDMEELLSEVVEEVNQARQQAELAAASVVEELVRSVDKPVVEDILDDVIESVFEESGCTSSSETQRASADQVTTSSDVLGESSLEERQAFTDSEKELQNMLSLIDNPSANDTTTESSWEDIPVEPMTEEQERTSTNEDISSDVENNQSEQLLQSEIQEEHS